MFPVCVCVCACVLPLVIRSVPPQMQRWIDQAKNKLLDIITQAKEDVANISLRVAFVGCERTRCGREGNKSAHTSTRPSPAARVGAVR